MSQITKKPGEPVLLTAAEERSELISSLRKKAPRSRTRAAGIHRTLPPVLKDDQQNMEPENNQSPAVPPHLASLLLALDAQTRARQAQQKPASKLSGWYVEPSNREALNQGARLLPSRPVQMGQSRVYEMADGRALIGQIGAHELVATIAAIGGRGLAIGTMRLESSVDEPGKLQRVDYRGKSRKVRDGTYPFGLDQLGQVLIPATVDAKGHAGAHRALVGGLPLLFAGELTIRTVDGEQKVVSFCGKSGNYQTPEDVPKFQLQARTHVLLRDAQFISLRELAESMDLLELGDDKP